MNPETAQKPDFLFAILCGIFVTTLLVADLIGSKLITIGGFLLSAGILPFLVTFILTDLINEFYGRQGARFVTFLGLGMAILANALLGLARLIPATPDSPLSDPVFNMVFGLSARLFLASLTAYLLGQLVDIQVFYFLRRITNAKMLWLRATGSTVVSQLIDSIVVSFIAFGGKLPIFEIQTIAINNYSAKFLAAVALTPLCYLGHAVLHRWMHRDKPTTSTLPESLGETIPALPL